MKFLLLVALSLSNVFCYLYELSDATQKCNNNNPALTPIGKSGFTSYFSIPLGDGALEFVSFCIYFGTGTDYAEIEFPDEEKVTQMEIASDSDPRICHKVDGDYKMKGKIYFVKKDYKDMDLYYFKAADYSVTITKNFTTIFSKNDGGSTLSKLKTDEQTAFQIYSGLPGEGDTVIYTYDPQLKLDSIFIPEGHFYILNTGSSTAWSFTVQDGGETPIGKTFDGNGFIMTPGFPNQKPSNDFLNLKVKLKIRTEDKLIKIMVSTIETTDETTTQKEGIQLNDATQKLIVTIGNEDCEFDVTKQLGSGSCKQLLPKSSDSFNIKSPDAAYTIQFNLEDIPSTTPNPTTKPLPVTVTTVKPTPAPEGTCAPSSCPATTPCPNTTCQVCPTVPVCSCSTSTTEVPSTTMGSSTKTVALLISLLTVYYAF